MNADIPRGWVGRPGEKGYGWPLSSKAAGEWWQCYRQFVEDRRRVAEAMLHFEDKILRAICEGQGQVTDADVSTTDSKLST